MPIKIDKLVRSHRKTIGLQITNDARLIVRAPHFTSEDIIQKLIQRKESWIKSKLNYYTDRKNKILKRTYAPGEEFLFLGQSYPLVPIEDLPKAIILGNSLMISPMVLANARDHLETWYKNQALEHITHRVDYYAQMLGLRYQSIRINDATTRWASCGYKDTLNFSWRLIMAPLRVVDYVVVHELTHIRQKDHSRKFWSEVKKVITDYKLDERWLKENSLLMAWP